MHTVIKGVVRLTVIGLATLAISSSPSFATVIPAGFGQVMNIDLWNAQTPITNFTVSLFPDTVLTGSTTCPGAPGGASDYTGPAFNVELSVVNTGPNDVVSFFQGATKVLDITHLRSNVWTKYPVTNNVVQNRQDWTRVRDNPNGIDGATGIRHYIGTFSMETQYKAKTDSDGKIVVTPAPKATVTTTGITQGVITLREPIVVQSGPLAGIAQSVDALQSLGPMDAFYEPFHAADKRLCDFSRGGPPTAVNPIYRTCTPDQNIVGCPAAGYQGGATP